MAFLSLRSVRWDRSKSRGPKATEQAGFYLKFPAFCQQKQESGGWVGGPSAAYSGVSEVRYKAMLFPGTAGDESTKVLYGLIFVQAVSFREQSQYGSGRPVLVAPQRPGGAFPTLIRNSYPQPLSATLVHGELGRAVGGPARGGDGYRHRSRRESRGHIRRHLRVRNYGEGGRLHSAKFDHSGLSQP